MFQSWNCITFLHWRYPPAVIKPFLPDHLDVDVHDGSGWVSVTPFLLANLHPPGLPPLPWLSTAPETNVRTYVRSPDGKRGIWFFSLDIARLPAVLFARAVYVLPYLWSDMVVEEDGTRMRYAGRRRPLQRQASYDITVEIGAPYAEDELTELDHFLTARWSVHMHYGPVPATILAEHPPWPLVRATVTHCEETLIVSGGLPAPVGPPLVHFSRGVDVRISPPLLRRRPAGDAARRPEGTPAGPS